jgi:methionyl-tRNA formyltransferase
MKIIFAGTPEFAATALAALYDAGFEIVLVLTQPDRPAGRGMQLQASAVKQFAIAHQIPVAQPASLRLDGQYAAQAEATHTLLHETVHDVMVVAAYGLILPSSVLKIAPLGCINIHASLLPRWRGAAPIHRAIEAGDAVTGISIMQMDAGLDTGPVLAMQALPITGDDTTGTLHDRLACLGGAMIVETLRPLSDPLLLSKSKQVPAQSQATDGVTYAAKIRKNEATLNFSESAAVVARKVRAWNPFPGAIAHFETTPIKFWHAVDMPERAGARSAAIAAGTILAADTEQGILVACGQGSTASVLQVTTLQRPGGKKMASEDFIQGFMLEGGCFT